MSRKPSSKRPGRPPAPRRPPPDGVIVAPGDVALVIGRDEHGTHILRRRSVGGPVEQGLLQPLAEGKPIDGEVVSLRSRPEFPLLFDVKSEFTPPSIQGRTPPEDSPEPAAGRLTSDGPAQVASDAYRQGWDAVWGNRRDKSLN